MAADALEALPSTPDPAPDPGRVLYAQQKLAVLAAIARGDASGWPADSAYQNPWGNPRNHAYGRWSCVQDLIALDRDATAAAYLALEPEDRKALLADGVFAEVGPQPPENRSPAGGDGPPIRLRVVPCGYVDVETGQWVGPSEVAAHAMQRRAEWRVFAALEPARAAGGEQAPVIAPAPARPVFGEPPPRARRTRTKQVP